MSFNRSALAESFPDLKLLEEQLFNSLDGGGQVKDDASQELRRLRQRKHSATARIGKNPILHFRQEP